MPPLALRSAAACSAPFLSWAPNAALGPVSGPATPTLICADAPPAQAMLAAMASAGQNTFFIRGLPISRQENAERTLPARLAPDDPTKAWQSHDQLQRQECGAMRQRCSGNGPLLEQDRFRLIHVAWNARCGLKRE